MPLGLFRGRRTFTLTPIDDAIRFEMREEYTGLLASLIVGRFRTSSPHSTRSAPRSRNGPSRS